MRLLLGILLLTIPVSAQVTFEVNEWATTAKESEKKLSDSITNLHKAMNDGDEKAIFETHIIAILALGDTENCQAEMAARLLMVSKVSGGRINKSSNEKLNQESKDLLAYLISFSGKSFENEKQFLFKIPDIQME
jgi:hypothetical protein